MLVVLTSNWHMARSFFKKDFRGTEGVVAAGVSPAVEPVTLPGGARRR
jgi:hypothetical protein